MAEEPGTAKNKRRVRNPETFRERAIKAADNSDKPAKKQRLRNVGAIITGPVRRPIGRAAENPVFRNQPFTFIGKVLHLLGKIVLPVYIRKSWQELRLVSWPSRKESRRLTVAVLMFAIVFGAVVAGLDYGLDKVFRNVLLK